MVSKWPSTTKSAWASPCNLEVDAATVLLVREYAAGLHRYELGLVKGRIDAGETPLQAADRELKEEAGYGARRLEVVRTLSLAPVYMSHETTVVLARELYPERLPGDEPEELEVVPWPLASIGELALREARGGRRRSGDEQVVLVVAVEGVDERGVRTERFDANHRLDIAEAVVGNDAGAQIGDHALRRARREGIDPPAREVSRRVAAAVRRGTGLAAATGMVVQAPSGT